jgi:Flp pilus assembly protein CpaB
MRLQNLFTIIALVALAALVGLVVRSLLAPSQRAAQATNISREAPAQTNLPQIWVARETLQTGQFLDPADFEAHDWPVSVGVDAVAANSGLVLPGDRVDLILTQNLGTSGSASRAHVGETIARAVRVLAVGKDLTTPQDSKNVDDRPRTVTLEVTPKQAEEIAVAAAIGDIRLSLRSLGATPSDKEEDEAATTGADLSKPDGPTWAGDVSTALIAGGVSVMRGSTSSAH